MDETADHPKSPSDAGLLSLISSGDEQALASLYDRYGGMLYSLAIRMTRDGHLAEEAVQNAFLSVWRSADTFDVGRGAVSTWLVTILKNRTRDLLRTRKRSDHHLLGWEFAHDNETDPHTEAEERILAQEVRQALLNLPKEQREVVQLTYYIGLTHRETSEHLDVPLGTVKSRLRLAVDRLALTLSKGGR